MRLFKPNQLTTLHRPLEVGGRQLLSVAVIGFFSFERPGILLPEVNMWKLTADKLGDRPLDEGNPKPHGELLVTGSAFPGDGGARAVTGLEIRAALGSIDKRLYVVGERHWIGDKPSEPLPFKAMPIDWAHAFGGEEYGPNPDGKGLLPVDMDGPMVHLLPNVEDPRRGIESPNDRPPPVGFDSFGVTYEQRRQYEGTYTGGWFPLEYPGLPSDFDARFFNTAPADQWCEGYFRGDEPFELEHLHPSKSKLASCLPSVRARAFALFDADRHPDDESAEAAALREIPLRLDTVHLFPDAERGVIIFRGTTPIHEPDATDVATLMLAAERLGEPKPRSHYEHAYVARLDKTKGSILALASTDLLPERPKDDTKLDAETFHDMAEILEREGHLQANMKRRAQAEQDAMRDKIRELGEDPDAHGVPESTDIDPSATPSIDELPDIIDKMQQKAEDERTKAEQKKEEAIAKARELCKQQGVDFDELSKQTKAGQAGPPKFKAAEQIEMLEQQRELAANSGVPLPLVEARLADPKLREDLKKAEDQMRLAYRKSAHQRPAITPLSAEAATALGRQLIEAAQRGESLYDRDFSGADLTGAMLASANLRGVFLEGANLSGSDVNGADLSDAVLTRAKLSDANFRQSNLSEANLGESELTRADLSGATLNKTVLSQAKLSETMFRGARLTSILFIDAELEGCQFDDSQFVSPVFLERNLRKTSFVRASFDKAVFIKCVLDQADFNGAILSEALLIETSAKSATFVDADLRGMKTQMESNFDGCDFSRAKLEHACLRGTTLRRCRFDSAEFPGADFSTCDATGSSFYRARGAGCKMMHTVLDKASMRGVNLMEAKMHRARLRGTDLSGSNLFRADLMDAVGDEATKLDGALTARVRFRHGSAIQKKGTPAETGAEPAS